MDHEQFKTCGVLQDSTTPISRVDMLITNLLSRLLGLVFGDQASGPQLLHPTVAPTSWTQRVLLRMTEGEYVVADFAPDIIDAAWTAVREYCARVMACWSKRFPLRALFAALAIIDNTTKYGRTLPEHGDGSITSCFAYLSRHFSCCQKIWTEQWHMMSDWLLNSCAGPTEITPEESERLLLEFLRMKKCDIDKTWLNILTIQLIFTKSSAELERDFKAMRQLQQASSVQLGTNELARRLRLSLNCPSVLDLDANAKQFIAKVVTAWQMEEAERIGPAGSTPSSTPIVIGTLRTGRRRGRPRKAAGAISCKAKRRKIMGAKYEAKAVSQSRSLREDLVDLTTDDPLALVQCLTERADSKPSITLLEAAKRAAEERSKEVARAREEVEAAKSTMEVKRQEAMPHLPKIVAKKGVLLTMKEYRRYFAMLLKPCGRPSSSIRVNVNQFVDEYCTYLERDASNELRYKRLNRLDESDTVDARVKFVLHGRAEMTKASPSSSSTSAVKAF